MTDRTSELARGTNHACSRPAIRLEVFLKRLHNLVRSNPSPGAITDCNRRAQVMPRCERLMGSKIVRTALGGRIAQGRPVLGFHLPDVAQLLTASVPPDVSGHEVPNPFEHADAHAILQRAGKRATLEARVLVPTAEIDEMLLALGHGGHARVALDKRPVLLAPLLAAPQGLEVGRGVARFADLSSTMALRPRRSTTLQWIFSLAGTRSRTTLLRLACDQTPIRLGGAKGMRRLGNRLLSHQPELDR